MKKYIITLYAKKNGFVKYSIKGYKKKKNSRNILILNKNLWINLTKQKYESILEMEVMEYAVSEEKNLYH